jgi:hypothetical protein
VRYQYGVRLLRTILALLLAVAWMPLTEHCQLESLTGLAVLRCGPVEVGGAPDGSPCHGESCCSWESGQYQLPPGQPEVAAPLLAVSPRVLAVEIEEAQAAAVGSFLMDAPPEPPRPWQFSLRAALPVRAPSIAS